VFCDLFYCNVISAFCWFLKVRTTALNISTTKKHQIFQTKY